MDPNPTPTAVPPADPPQTSPATPPPPAPQQQPVVATPSSPQPSQFSYLRDVDSAQFVPEILTSLRQSTSPSKTPVTSQSSSTPPSTIPTAQQSRLSEVAAAAASVPIDGNLPVGPQSETAEPTSTALMTATTAALHVVTPSGQKYLDLSEYLTLSQGEAARKLGMPSSTLSKRWKEAVRGRKWPHRTVAKLDREILTLLHNIPPGTAISDLPEEVETQLALLMRKRQEELRPVIIRLT